MGEFLRGSRKRQRGGKWRSAPAFRDFWCCAFEFSLHHHQQNNDSTRAPQRAAGWPGWSFSWRGGFLITARTILRTAPSQKRWPQVCSYFLWLQLSLKKKKRKSRKNTPVLSKQKLQFCMNQINSHWGNWSKERILCLKPGVYVNVCKVVPLFKTHICIWLKIRNSYLEHSEAVCQECWNSFLKTVYICMCIYYN